MEGTARWSGAGAVARAAFCFAAESGSFRRAASDLQVSPARARDLVRSLEERAGTPLLFEDEGSVRLTPEGERLYFRWKGPVHRLLGFGRPAPASSPSRVWVTVSAPTSTGSTLLSPMVGRFALANPGVSVDLRLTHGFYHPLWEGVDLRIGHGEYFLEDVESHPLGAVRRILVASPAYLERAGRPAAPGDLVRHEVFGPKDAVDQDSIAFRCGRREERVSPSSRIALRSHLSALFCALSGLGIGVMVPEYLAAPYLGRGELVRVLPDWGVAPLPLRAFFSPGNPKSGVRALVEFLEAECRKSPYIEGLPK